MKIRSFESPVYGAAWAHLGANPTTIAYTETYLALKQNMVQGAVLPICDLYTMKWSEVGKYVTEIDEFPQDVAIIMNNKTFEGLSSDLQQIVIDAANEAGTYGTKLNIEAAQENIKKCEQEHGIEYYILDTTKWQEQMKPLFYKFEEQGLLSEGIIDEILSF
jgi:TRAP-type C4-dicarboxylate transport system substrate-binding protein